MDEIRPGGIEPVEIETFQQGELLKQDRPLAPDAGLAHRVAPVVVGQRRLDRRLPRGHVGAGEHAAMRLARYVHHLLGAAEAVDRLGHKALRPGAARALDLRHAIAPGALGLGQDARVGLRQTSCC